MASLFRKDLPVFRFLIPPAAVIVGAATVLLAAERATFILSDGERVSGTVVFHTEARSNVRADKNELNLGVANGQERPFPMNQVIVIDFVGGQPDNKELSAIPNSGQLLSLRDGSTRRGRFVDLIGGDTVRWQNENGEQTDIRITDARRIYLNADRSREVFNYKPAPPPTADTAPLDPTPGNNARDRRGNPIAGIGNPMSIQASTAWTDTTITVRRGETLKVESSGRVMFSRDRGAIATTAGSGQPGRQYPVPTLPVGALIGKIGNDGRPFAIGSGTSISASGTGRLFLGVNDDDFSDNSGAFTVTITR